MPQPASHDNPPGPSSPLPGVGLGRVLRSRLFMGWMVTLGSFYLLVVLALLAGNIQYMHDESIADLRREKEAAWLAANPLPATAAPPATSQPVTSQPATSQPAAATAGPASTPRRAVPPGVVRISFVEKFLAWGRMLKRTLLNEHLRYATILSFVTSTVTVILAMLVGIPTAYILSRRRFWGLTVIDTILDIPIVLPPLVIGVSLLIFFQTDLGRWINRAFPGELVFQPAGIVLAQFTVACAFGIRTLKATFEQIDPRIEAVARTLGATKGQAFFRLTLPMSRDGIMAAGVMTWARAIGEFGPILIFCGTTKMRTEVLPTSVFLEFQVGNLQAALAVSMFMILISVVTLLVFKKLGGIRFV